MHTICPAGISRSIPRNTVVSPKRLINCLARTLTISQRESATLAPARSASSSWPGADLVDRHLEDGYPKALERMRETESILMDLVRLLKTPQPEDLPRRVERLQEELRDSKRKLAKLTSESVADAAGDLIANAPQVGDARIIVHHALPNAWAPIVNVIVLNLAYLIVGVVVVEVVFVYPGLGQLLVDSVQRRDLPVVQACCLIFAATYVLLNLIADILSIMTNPRLLHPK